jgi:hypothetical protein
MKHRRALQRWHAEAGPILRALMTAEDMLISGSEGPALVVEALCDQLLAAVAHAQSWLGSHRCPDAKLGVYVTELVSASRGMWAIMQMIAREAPRGEWFADRDLVEKVGTNLADRIEQATRARMYIRQWSA